MHRSSATVERFRAVGARRRTTARAFVSACRFAFALLFVVPCVARAQNEPAAPARPQEKSAPKAAAKAVAVVPLAFERLIPADVMVFASAPRAETLVTALKTKSPFASLLANNEVAAFLSPLTEGLANLQKDVSGFFGVGPTDLIEALHGPLAIAITGPDGEGLQPMPSAVVALSLKNSQPLQFAVRRLARMLPMGYDVTVENEAVAGQTVTVFEWGERFAVYASFVGDVLYVSNAASAMEDVLLNLRRGGAENCLADAPAFQRAALRVEARRSHHFVYVNLDAIWLHGDAVFARGFPEYALVMKALDARRLHTLAMSVEVEERGFRERAYVGGKEAAVRKLLRPGLTGSARVAPSAIAYSGLRMNWPAWYEWVKATLDGAAQTLESGPAREAYRYLRLGEEGALGVDIERDVIGALGEEVTLRMNLPVGGLVPQVLALIEVREPDRLREAFRKMKEAIAKDSGVKFVVSKYRSQLIYRLQGSRAIEPSFAIVDKTLVVSVNASIVKRWIRRKESGLDETEAFRGSLARVGVEDLTTALSALFVDTRRLMAFTYDNLSGLLAEAQPFRIDLGMRAARLSFATLPSTDAITRHFEPLTVVTRLVEDGVRIDAFSPVPYSGVAYALFEGIWFTGMTGGVPAAAGVGPTAGAESAKGAAKGEAPNPAGETKGATAASRRIPGELGILVDDDYSADGCRIAKVIAGTAGSDGGLEDGDVISRIDGVALPDADAAFAVLEKKSAGQKVRLHVVRGGKTLTIEITLRPKP